MRRFSRGDVEAFFHAIDGALASPVDLIVLGGSAIFAWAPGAPRTADIDTWELSAEEGQRLERAVETVRAAGEMVIPIGNEATRVAQLPDDFEDRCTPWELGLQRLSVRVVEPHDLVLSKIDRWQVRDEEQVRELHAEHPLDRETLVTRYLEMRFTKMWNVGKVDANLLECIEVMFGELARVDISRRLVAHKRSY